MNDVQKAIAEVERLTTALAAARLAVEKWQAPRHADDCDESCGAGCTNHRSCNCDYAGRVFARSEARRAVGLEVVE